MNRIMKGVLALALVLSTGLSAHASQWCSEHAPSGVPVEKVNSWCAAYDQTIAGGGGAQECFNTYFNVYQEMYAWYQGERAKCVNNATTETEKNQCADIYSALIQKLGNWNYDLRRECINRK